jgi:hypothetical protein
MPVCHHSAQMLLVPTPPLPTVNSLPLQDCADALQPALPPHASRLPSCCHPLAQAAPAGSGRGRGAL